MSFMKKKNQMIITALALMIAVAGYLNFAGTKFKQDTVEASSHHVTSEEDDEIALDISDEDTFRYSEGDIESLDTDITSLEELEGEFEKADSLSEEETVEMEGQITDENSDVQTEDEDSMEPDTSEPGQAVFTDTSALEIVANAKLQKEQTRAKNKETLMEVINSASVSETQKQTAIDGMIAMTDVAERETAAENLLAAKGFSDVVVSITGKSADVLVSAEELSEAKIAQIEDVIQRKAGIAAENIVITPITPSE